MAFKIGKRYYFKERPSFIVYMLTLYSTYASYNLVIIRMTMYNVCSVIIIINCVHKNVIAIALRILHYYSA